MMPIGDPRDGFFYPTLTLTVESYILVFGTSVLLIVDKFVSRVARIITSAPLLIAVGLLVC